MIIKISVKIKAQLHPVVLTDDMATGLALLTWATAYKKSKGELG